MGELPGQSLHQPSPVARIAERPAAPAGPWQVRHRAAPADALPPHLLSATVGSELPTGIERRLPRRAEQLWNRLRGDQPIPPAVAASALLAPPFATLAMLVKKPARRRPMIAYAGSEVGALGSAGVGPATADARPSAAIPDRLVALSLAAIAAGEPRHLDSDFDPDTAAPGPGILFRAVALPLVPDPASGLSGLAVTVLSWRRLLSPDETAALHSELRAAMSWLGSTIGPDQAR